MKSFTSKENKSLLWNLMSETNAFGGLPEEKYSQVKDIFEKEIMVQYNLYSSSNKAVTLIELNKHFLLEITNKLHPIRNIPLPIPPSIPVTSSDISQQRQMQFSTNLSVRQREFSNLINSDKPKAIDFSDTIEDEVVEDNVVEDLDSIIKRRAQQLTTAMTTHDKNAASKWIGRGDKHSSALGSKRDNDKDNTSIAREDSIQLQDFLSQLSDDSDNREEIIREIKEIYTNVLFGMRTLDKLINRL
jgi:hypothetical protein